MKNGVVINQNGDRVKGNDALFLQFVVNKEKAATAKKEIKYGLDDPGAIDYILKKALEIMPSSCSQFGFLSETTVNKLLLNLYLDKFSYVTAF